MGLKELESIINKEYGKGIMYVADQKKILPIKRFSSGSLSLDIDLGGGWPEGKIIEIYGPESSGKSFALYHAMKTITNRKKNNQVAIIDEEGTFENEWASDLGINLSKVRVVRSQNAEQALDILEALIESGELALVGVDSVAALIPAKEKEESHENQNMALLARLMAKTCRKLFSALNEADRNGTRTTVIFINQIRMMIGNVWGNPETTTGGKSLKFASAIRMDLRRKKKEEELEDENVVSVVSKYDIVKNKTAPPFRTGFIKFYVDETKDGKVKASIDNDRALFDIGLENGKIVKSGSFYSGSWLAKGKKIRGSKRCAQFLSKLSSEKKNQRIEDLEKTLMTGKKIAFRF